MKLWECCREIQLEGFFRTIKRGDVLSGFNTNSEKVEKVIIVKVAKNPNFTIVTPYTDKAFKKYNKSKKKKRNK